MEILERDRAHCMISTHTDGSHGLDLEHHFQAASRAFYANNSILSDKTMSIAQRLVYFDAMVTPVEDWKANKRMGCVNTNVLPMAKFGRLEGHSNADKFLADTYGLLY